MTILLLRKHFTDTATLGELFIDGKHFAYTLEDKLRDLGPDGSGKVQNRTAIAAGKYEVVLTYSNRFKKYLPLLLEVPFFAGIRIHGGNTHENTEGCILIGANQDVRGERIWNCSGRMNELMSRLRLREKKEKVHIIIMNDAQPAGATAQATGAAHQQA